MLQIERIRANAARAKLDSERVEAATAAKEKIFATSWSSSHSMFAVGFIEA